MRVRPGNAQHVGRREGQEDAFAFSDDRDRRLVAHAGVMGVVADGMGGLERGAEASGAAVRAFLHAYAGKPAHESVPRALGRAFDAAAAAVHALQAEARVTAGATLAAAAIVDASLWWISAGDSRVYHACGRALKQMTRDHVRGEEAPDPAEQGTLTSHLGPAEVPLVDRNAEPLRLEPGDRVLVCSDGLYRAVAPDEMLRLLGVPDPQQAADALVQAALAAQAPDQDNVTALVLACDAEARPGRWWAWLALSAAGALAAWWVFR